MGLYNIVTGTMVCPRCRTTVDAEVETRLGDTHQLARLTIGDRYPWPSGRRPEQGNAIGDGYCVCPLCGKDFFVNVVVESDRLTELRADLSRSGYIADDEQGDRANSAPPSG